MIRMHAARSLRRIAISELGRFKRTYVAASDLARRRHTSSRALIASLLIPIGWAVLTRNWRIALWLGLGLIGGYAVMRMLPIGIAALVGQPIVGPELEGLVDVTAVVLIPEVRLTLLLFVAQIGLPTLKLEERVVIQA